MKSSLLIVDVQNGFITSHTDHIPRRVENIQSLYDNIFVTKFYNDANSFYRTLIKWEKLSKNSTDFELAFAPNDRSLIIEKNIYTCVSNNFLQTLKQNNINEVDICGIDTEICVTKCAVDLIENGIRPRILANYCASTAGQAAHQNALRVLARFVGKEQVYFGNIEL